MAEPGHASDHVRDDPLAEITLDSRIEYDGVFLRLYVDTIRAPDGHVATREYLRHPGAVMMIPLLDDGRVVLERQFRYPVGRSFIEFPAGKLERDEDVLACAQRELLEETGYVAADWTYLGRFYNAIGYSDERIEVYVACKLSYKGGRTDDGEVLEIFSASVEELLGWIATGHVTDVKTIVGAFWLQQHIAGTWPRRSPAR